MPPVAEAGDAAYEQALTQALALRARITGRKTDKIDVDDELDARCLEAALQGSSAVNLEGIDISKYRRS